MTQESDRTLYIHLHNLLCDSFCESNEFRSFYRRGLEEIQSRYDKDTTRKWVEKVR